MNCRIKLIYPFQTGVQFHAFISLLHLPFPIFFFLLIHIPSINSVSRNPFTRFSSTATPLRSFAKIVFCTVLNLFGGEEFKATFNLLELNIRNLVWLVLTNPSPTANFSNTAAGTKSVPVYLLQRKEDRSDSVLQNVRKDTSAVWDRTGVSGFMWLPGPVEVFRKVCRRVLYVFRPKDVQYLKSTEVCIFNYRWKRKV